MTRDETLELWQECEKARAVALSSGRSKDEAHEAAKAIWNTWATVLLSQRQKLESSGQFVARRTPRGETEGLNVTTSTWLDYSSAIFCDFDFTTETSFNGFIFPGIANFGHWDTRKIGDFIPARFAKRIDFGSTMFCESAWFLGASFPDGTIFRNAVFHGDALFGGVQFNSPSWFIGTTFSRDAWFSGAAFRGATRFINAIFRGSALFSGCDFASYTSFDGTRFLGEVDFSALQVSGRFDLRQASFSSDVPSFVQANFSQAPQIDNIDIPMPGFFSVSNSERIASYRALRRIAIQGQDYENEWRAFKGEMRAKRGSAQKPWHVAFWINLIYDALSDFGWSVMRPFLIWLISIMLFAVVYLISAHRLTQFAGACITKGGYTAIHWLNACLLSAKNAILFVGLDRGIQDQLVCIYGDTVPAWSAFIFMGQNLLSAVLIFLFLFAIRNQFRIK